MSYIIKSSLLPTDYREEMIKKTLDLYLTGDNLYYSPLAEWGRKVVARGDWWYGCEGKTGIDLEDCILRRQSQVFKLYHSLKDHGYKGTPISIYFDKKTGEVQTYDGFHRLSIMKYLGLEADMNCIVSHHHPDPKQRGDFPLVDRLIELNSGRNLYQPVNDPRIEDWNLWRPDSFLRLEYLTKIHALVPGSVLDAGCETGYFCREFARRGYQVTGIDSKEKALAVARYVATIKNIEVDFIQGQWQHELKGRHFDNILFLSVLHHDILARGVDQLQEDLKILRGSCTRLIVEMPLAAAGVKWLKDHQKNFWDFTLAEFVLLLEEATEMTFRDVGFLQLKDRPVIILESPK